MTLLANSADKYNKNGAAPLFAPHSAPNGTRFPQINQTMTRKSIFARDLWRVETRPGFAVSSLYGRGK